MDELDDIQTPTQDADNRFGDMSDDEFAALDFDEYLNKTSASPDESEEESVESEDSVVDEETGDDAPAEEAESNEETTESSDDSDSDESVETPEEEPKKDSQESSEPDYKAAYEKLMAPFRANGKEMKVDSIDEAIQLMQMGANYNKKMMALKPSLKTLKLLEKNGLLDEQKLSFLIDLDKKNPEAIRKLIKDSGIDPLDMDVSTESDYKPQSYTVDDRELVLDEVLEEIKETPTYSRTIGIVAGKWDQASKQIVANNPQLLKVINDHVASGIYDLVSNAVEKERMFGRLVGLSDFEAYRQVGDALHAQGAFAKLEQQHQAPAKQVIQPKLKAKDEAIKDKKRAASSTRSKPPAKDLDDFNPLAVSDEEFERRFNAKFL